MGGRRGRIIGAVAFAVVVAWWFFRPATVGNVANRDGRAGWQGTLGAETPRDAPAPLPKRSANPRVAGASAMAVAQGTGVAALPADSVSPAVGATPAASTASHAGDTGGAGTAIIRVTAIFDGPLPSLKKLNFEADAFCARSAGGAPVFEEDVLVKNNALANVFVRILHGPAGASSASAEIDQTGCRYRPRVVGVLAGGDIRIKSNDDTTHNVHAYEGERSIFNRAQNKGEFTKKVSDLNVEDGPVTLKCDIHPWMTGILFVTDSPYFAITDATGSASIVAPPGHYTLQAWHEKYGFSTADVTVTAGVSSDVQFRIGRSAK